MGSLDALNDNVQGHEAKQALNHIQAANDRQRAVAVIERQFETGPLDPAGNVYDSIVEHEPLGGTVVTDWSQKFRHPSASGGTTHHHTRMLTSENVMWQHAPSPANTGPRGFKSPLPDSS